MRSHRAAPATLGLVMDVRRLDASTRTVTRRRRGRGLPGGRDRQVDRVHRRRRPGDLRGLRRATGSTPSSSPTPSTWPRCARPRADEVRAATGFAIGGVPPFGHDLPVILDEELLEHERVWAAAGDPHSLFSGGPARAGAAVPAPAWPPWARTTELRDGARSREPRSAGQPAPCRLVRMRLRCAPMHRAASPPLRGRPPPSPCSCSCRPPGRPLAGRRHRACADPRGPARPRPALRRFRPATRGRRAPLRGSQGGLGLVRADRLPAGGSTGTRPGAGTCPRA